MNIEEDIVKIKKTLEDSRKLIEVIQKEVKEFDPYIFDLYNRIETVYLILKRTRQIGRIITKTGGKYRKKTLKTSIQDNQNVFNKVLETFKNSMDSSIDDGVFDMEKISEFLITSIKNIFSDKKDDENDKGNKGKEEQHITMKIIIYGKSYSVIVKATAKIYEGVYNALRLAGEWNIVVKDWELRTIEGDLIDMEKGYKEQYLDLNDPNISYTLSKGAGTGG